MLTFLAIIVDDELRSPIYAEPSPDELDPEIWARVGEVVLEVQDGELKPNGHEKLGDGVLAWRALIRNGLTFIALAEDVEPADLKAYLKSLVQTYFDEVDDVRRPERDGVADVVVDVIPPWEE